MHASSTSGDAAERGGRWVAAQFVLIALVLLAAFLPPGWPGALELPLAAFGAACSLLGLLLAFWGWRGLGRAATPFPRPREDGRLVESGPYAYVRHPIYSGGLLFLGGLALATSPGALVPLALLAVLWRNKAALEEELLAERYGEYAEYREEVRGAFVPRPTSARRAG